jgi:hypothetical protein
MGPKSTGGRRKDLAALDPDTLTEAQLETCYRQLIDTAKRVPCPCQGAFDASHSGQHYVFLAFRHRKNGDYDSERWIRDYYVIPWNWATEKLSGSSMIHTQFFFWNHTDQTFDTVNVDAFRNVVHRQEHKEFKFGWTFLRLRVERWQENLLYHFLSTTAATAPPFGAWTARCMFFWPWAGRGQTYVCSELAIAALHMIGFATSLEGHSTPPAAIYRYITTADEFADRWDETHNPVAFRRRQQALDRSLGPVSARRGSSVHDTLRGAPPSSSTPPSTSRKSSKDVRLAAAADDDAAAEDSEDELAAFFRSSTNIKHV